MHLSGSKAGFIEFALRRASAKACHLFFTDRSALCALPGTPREERSFFLPGGHYLLTVYAAQIVRWRGYE
jgi:hypothetical protein